MAKEQQGRGPIAKPWQVSVGDDACIVPRYITLFARRNLLPPILPCGPMTSIGPYKPFAMFAAINKVFLRQGEGILLYKYF